MEAAQASLDRRRTSSAATRPQVDATNAANRSATARARTQLRVDQQSLDRAEEQLHADRTACRASPRTTTATPTAAVAPTGARRQTAVPTEPPRPTGTAVPTGTGGATGIAVPDRNRLPTTTPPLPR